MTGNAELHGPRPRDPFYGYHRKDWIDLCEDLKPRDKEVYGVLRALVYDNQRTGQRGDVRKLSLVELCDLIPGVNGKKATIGGLRDCLRRLGEVGLISEPCGRDNSGDKTLKTSTSTKAVTQLLRIRIHDVPWNNYTPRWHNLEEKLASIRTPTPSPRQGTPDPCWESNKPGDNAPEEGRACWGSNETCWGANETCWDPNSDTHPDQEKHDPFGCSYSAASTNYSLVTDDVGDEQTDPVQMQLDDGWTPDAAWVRDMLPPDTAPSPGDLNQCLAHTRWLLSQGLSSVQISHILASRPTAAKAVTSFLEATDTPAKAMKAADRARDYPGYHPGADELCTYLADAIETRTDYQRPTITREWRAQARLLLDNDTPLGKPVTGDRARRLIDWALQDSFWKIQIRSMAKFRKQFEPLAARANQEWREERRGRTFAGGGVAARSEAALAPETLYSLASRRRATVDPDGYNRLLERSRLEGREAEFHERSLDHTRVWFAGFCDAGGFPAHSLAPDMQQELAQVRYELAAQLTEPYDQGYRDGLEEVAARPNPGGMLPPV